MNPDAPAVGITEMTRFFYGRTARRGRSSGHDLRNRLGCLKAGLWLAAELSSNYPDLRGQTSVEVTPTVAENPAM